MSIRCYIDSCRECQGGATPSQHCRQHVLAPVLSTMVEKVHANFGDSSVGNITGNRNMFPAGERSWYPGTKAGNIFLSLPHTAPHSLLPSHSSLSYLSLTYHTQSECYCHTHTQFVTLQPLLYHTHDVIVLRRLYYRTPRTSLSYSRGLSYCTEDFKLDWNAMSLKT